MRKLFNSLLLAAMALTLPACGSDEPNPTPDRKTFNLELDDMVTFTFNLADQSVNHLCEADYDLIGISYNAEGSQLMKMIKVEDINFDPRMPVNISMNLTGDFSKAEFAVINPPSYSSISSFYLTGNIPNVRDIPLVDAAGTPTESRYKVSNLEAEFNEMFNVATIAYTVGDNQWRVVSMSNTIVSRSIVSTDQPSYELMLDVDKMTGELFLNNVQFEVGGVKSPVLKRISIPGITLSTTKGGLMATGNNIVPNYYMNGEPTPYPQLTVTNFVCYFNILDEKMDLSFDAHGGNYSVKDVPLYIFSPSPLAN